MEGGANAMDSVICHHWHGYHGSDQRAQRDFWHSARAGYRYRRCYRGYAWRASRQAFCQVGLLGNCRFDCRPLPTYGWGPFSKEGTCTEKANARKPRTLAPLAQARGTGGALLPCAFLLALVALLCPRLCYGGGALAMVL